MKVQGRDYTLTVAKDNEYYPLPYSEETVRQTSKGYVLPGCIGTRNREKIVKTGKYSKKIGLIGFLSKEINCSRKI